MPKKNLGPLTPTGYDRRKFLKTTAALGAAGIITPGLGLDAAFAATPKRGGTLRQALRGGATTDTLNGATLQAAHPINVSWQVRNNLTVIDADGNLDGELAESWESADGARRWIFDLRKGVEFHNGKTLDAADVIHSLNIHRGEDSGSAVSSIMSVIRDIRADGKHRIIVDLENPNVDFAYLMSDYHLVIGPEGTTGDQWDAGIGTGPFILEEWKPGVRAFTTRNPNYFKEGLPYFDAVETLNVADVAARTSALQTGEVDVIENPDLKTLHLLERLPNINILEVGGTRHFPYPMLKTASPFDNKDVQMALKLAIDREEWVDKVLQGHGYVGNDHPVGHNQRFFADALEQRSYDPDKARFHLRKAGYEDSLNLSLTAADVYPGGLDGAILYQASAKAAGINIEVKRVPNDGYWSDVPLSVPWHVSSLGGRVTVDWVMSVSYAADAPWNDTKWANERFNKLLVEARGELDEGKRAEMYFEMQQLVRDDCPTVIPAFANLIAATTDKIATPEKLASNSQLDGLRNCERWWFA
ncbi:MAG: ABC transporter substrate-binding protein [Roseovarius sp.]|nr:ABC transporter substrate-binding protein [Roseovarius sp.]